MEQQWYAGIGSRETPKNIAAQMQEFAFQAAMRGMGLRSGAAIGADSAFELGAIDACGEMQIFLHKKGANGHTSPFYTHMQEAERIAETIHPNWNGLSYTARMLISRNMHQIAGPRLDDPVQFVICWTPDGCESTEQYSIRTGGTGTAISFASQLGIPIYNLWWPNRLQQAYRLLDTL